MEIQMNKEKLYIFDTTLRDGAQTEGVNFSLDEKNKIAKLIRVPKFSEIPYPTIMEPNLVIEYYSR